jgi:competence protein ComEC
MVGVLAMATGRTRQALPALCTAVLALLAWRPEFATDLGFVLSVAATGGLVVLAPDWSRRLIGRGAPARVAEIAAVALAAFVATAPVVAAASGRVSFVSIVANAAVHVLVPVIMGLGLLAAAFSQVWLPLAAAVAWATGPPLWWLLHIAAWSGRIPGGSLPLPAGLAGAVVVIAAVVAGWLLAPVPSVWRPARTARRRARLAGRRIEP